MLGQGAFIDLAQGFLSPEAQERCHLALREELAWEARSIFLFGRAVLQPRLVAWAGELPYRYSGQTLPPRPFTPTAAALIAEVAARVGTPFNHVLANRYRDGRDSMGLHADAEPELGPDPVVATLSFGAPRLMKVLPRKGGDGARLDLVLGPGDLLVMGGTCQRHFRHGIPRVPAPAQVGERISLTLRQVLAPIAARATGSAAPS